MIASSLTELKREARDGGDEYTHTTLIIVPPSLVAQWVKEVEKSCGTTLSVKMLDANANTRDEIAKDLVSSRGRGTDILITTYSALEKPKTSQFYLLIFASSSFFIFNGLNIKILFFLSLLNNILYLRSNNLFHTLFIYLING